MRHFAIEGYEYPVLPTFSPCGRWLYGSGASFVAAWDLTGTSTEPAWMDFDSAGFLFRLIVSPCGRFLAGAEDRCVVVWDATTRGEAKWLSANPSGDHISDVAFTPDGSDLLTACIDGVGGVRRWRSGSWRRKPAFATRANCDGALAVSPDGRTVATADGGSKGVEGKRIKLWRYPQGTHRKTSAQSCGSIVRLRYSPDGALIASNDDRKRIQLWDAKTLRPVAEYVPQVKARKKVTEPVHSFAFHPSGRYLAVGGQAGPVEFVDTATWRPAVTFDWKFRRTYGVAFNTDGTLAAACSDKGQIVVWDVDV